MLDNSPSMRSARFRPARLRRWPPICKPARVRAEYGLLRPAVTAVGYSAEADALTEGPSALLKARLMKQVRPAQPAWPRTSVAGVRRRGLYCNRGRRRFV